MCILMSFRFLLLRNHGLTQKTLFASSCRVPLGAFLQTWVGARPQASAAHLAVSTDSLGLVCGLLPIAPLGCVPDLVSELTRNNIAGIYPRGHVLPQPTPFDCWLFFHHMKKHFFLIHSLAEEYFLFPDFACSEPRVYEHLSMSLCDSVFASRVKTQGWHFWVTLWTRV